MQANEFNLKPLMTSFQQTPPNVFIQLILNRVIDSIDNMTKMA